MYSYLMSAIIYSFFFLLQNCTMQTCILMSVCVLQGKSGTPGTMGAPGPLVGNTCCKQITRAFYTESETFTQILSLSSVSGAGWHAGRKRQSRPNWSCGKKKKNTFTSI